MTAACGHSFLPPKFLQCLCNAEHPTFVCVWCVVCVPDRPCSSRQEAKQRPTHPWLSQAAARKILPACLRVSERKRFCPSSHIWVEGDVCDVSMSGS
mmetsp:Transcript_6655/g.19323  ORF Transcript_6655/g.19323 Transcript_6655/m.19323 type:complete len:97 (-) Transcript_6655:1372-1662(-)